MGARCRELTRSQTITPLRKMKGQDDEAEEEWRPLRWEGRTRRRDMKDTKCLIQNTIVVQIKKSVNKIQLLPALFRLREYVSCLCSIRVASAKCEIKDIIETVLL